jgi:hypothetical protein
MSQVSAGGPPPSMGPGVHFVAAASRGRWSSTAARARGAERMRRVVLRGLRDAAGALGRAVAQDEYAHDVRAGWAPPSKPARRTLPLIVVVLTFTTGVVDAVSYVGLGRVSPGCRPATSWCSASPWPALRASRSPHRRYPSPVSSWVRGWAADWPLPRVFSCAFDRSAAGGRCRGSRRRAANRRGDCPTPAGHRVAGRRDGPPERHGTSPGGARGHDHGCDLDNHRVGGRLGSAGCGWHTASVATRHDRDQARWRGRGRPSCTGLAVRAVSAGCLTDRSRGRRLSRAGRRPTASPQPVSGPPASGS